MELKLYMRMILRQWWLVAAAFIITVAATAVLVSRQPWVYESTTTFIIRPRPDFTEAADDFVRAIDTLSRHTDINTTFSQVADSRVIRQRALDRLALSAEERQGLQISGAAVAGSNILEITVRGPNPGAVRDMANAVGAEAAIYMRELYDVFELELLDEAGLPSSPAGPNKMLTLIVGAVLGLMLGVALVFVSEYVQQPLEDEEAFNIIDGKSGLYNKAYFLTRLNQEMSRVENSDQTFSLALITLKSRRLATGIQQTISSEDGTGLLIAALAPNIRKEDVLARVDESHFALLLPAMSEEAAEGLLKPLHRQVRTNKAAYQGLDGGATIDVIAVTLTIGSANVYQSHDDLFEQMITLLAENEQMTQDRVATRGQHSRGLLFLTGGEKTESSDPETRGRRQVGE